MGYQSRVPLQTLKQEAVRLSIAFTLGLSEIHKFVHLLIKPVHLLIKPVRCTFIHLQCNLGRTGVPVTVSLLYWSYSKEKQNYCRHILGVEHCEEYIIPHIFRCLMEFCN